MNSILCQHCHNAPATVHVKERINGQETHRHLCSACAAKEGFTGNVFSSLWEKDPFENLLGSLFSPARAVGTGRCPTCGRTPADVKRTGRFGCGDCYSALEDRLDLSPFTAPDGYKGKRPTQSEKSPAAPGAESAPTPETSIASLKKRLKQAVENEEYETAAKLRDELRALENKEEK